MKYIFALCGLFLITSTNIFGQTESKNHHPFSGTLVMGFEGGATAALTDYSTVRVGYMGKGFLEYFLPSSSSSSFGFRVLGSAGYLSGEDWGQKPSLFKTDFSSIGGGFVYMVEIRKRFFPYLFAGVSSMWFYPKDEDGNMLVNFKKKVYDKQELNYLAELGFRLVITDDLSFNLNGGVHISSNDYFDDVAGNANNDMFFTGMMGISYSFFNKKDSDKDGVVDSDDKCPNTPVGIEVTPLGCPVDSDGDGVYDYLDDCPGTPRKVKVDRNGCALDSDKDAVPDYVDLCPETPFGIEVDDYGCPYDKDVDGVPDYKDKCPNTPYNTEVDKNGCPRDSDLDGVPDTEDKCPDTPAGVQVDTDGCQKVIKEEEPAPEPEKRERKITLSSAASFKYGSADLLPAAHQELNKVIAMIKSIPGSRWKIEGHTDSAGSEEANKRMSLKRAEAVLDYFVSKGLNKNRFEIAGMGEKFPIADNSTEKGRAKNRRVEIIRIK